MKNNNYKILVLSDLKNSSSAALNNAISLAKMIHGTVAFFHVKKPIDVIEKENQLSAMRKINEDRNATEKKIRDLIIPLSKEHGINIDYKFSLGNIKNEISKLIETMKPDIVVIGKKKSKTLNLLGDNITQFILNKHKGVVMISTNNNTLEPNKELSLGMLDGPEQFSKIDFHEALMEHTKKPLKSFRILEKFDTLHPTGIANSNKTVEYVFEKNDNSINNLPTYLSKHDVNLLCINRNAQSASNYITSDVKDIINKVNVPMLFFSRN